MEKVVAVAATVVVLAVLTLAGAVGGTVSAVHGGTRTSGPSQTALDDIPADYLTLYQQAADLCPGLDWTVLAAIGKIESDHGRSALPGVAPGTRHPTSRAMGPMQFLGATFADVRARHPEVGADVYDPADAISAAAHYLCDNGARDGRDLRKAIFIYNNADWYVRDVLAQSEDYRGVPAENRPGGELRLNWTSEQPTVPDPTTDGHLTPRTYRLARVLQQGGMTGNGLVCFGQRPSNPASDHPKGRACDAFFDPDDKSAVADGWQVANWLVEHQATYGVHYIIWQGKFWSALDPQWVDYTSDAYSCPNPANLTGCHYDHVHVSVY